MRFDMDDVQRYIWVVLCCMEAAFPQKLKRFMFPTTISLTQKKDAKA
jgi:hypothetical protein